MDLDDRTGLLATLSGDLQDHNHFVPFTVILEHCSRIQRKNMDIKPQKCPSELAKDLGSELADLPAQEEGSKVGPPGPPGSVQGSKVGPQRAQGPPKGTPETSQMGPSGHTQKQGARTEGFGPGSGLAPRGGPSFVEGSTGVGPYGSRSGKPSPALCDILSSLWTWRLVCRA